MSCQQVSQIAEDPYMFTESPITTTTFFKNSIPVQKSTFGKISMKAKDNFPRKSNTFIEKQNASNENQKQNIHNIQGKPVYDNSKQIIKATDTTFGRNAEETIKVQKRINRRLHSTNSIAITETKPIHFDNDNWKTLKTGKQSMKSKQNHLKLMNGKSNHAIHMKNVMPINKKLNKIDDVQQDAMPVISKDSQHSLIRNIGKLQENVKKSTSNTGNELKRNASGCKLVTNQTEGTNHVNIIKANEKNLPNESVLKSNDGMYNNVKKQQTVEKINNRRPTIDTDIRTKDDNKECINATLFEEKLISTGNRINEIDDVLLPKKYRKEWHAPESYIYDDFYIMNDWFNDNNSNLINCVQTIWYCDTLNENTSTREQRLETKRDNLRRQAFQYAQAQNFRTKALAKRRLITVSEVLTKFKIERHRATSQSKCAIHSCSNAALAMTAYCKLHITHNKDQKLFQPCTAKFSDNSQCRLPVFDITHELPLCREHAWKRDNYNKIVHEQKPKKNILRNINKPSKLQNDITQSSKRKNKNKIKLISSNNSLNISTNKNVSKNSSHNVQRGFNSVWKMDKNKSAYAIVSAAMMNGTTNSPGSTTGVTMLHLTSNSAPVSKLKLTSVLQRCPIIDRKIDGKNCSNYENTDDSTDGTVILDDTELINASDAIEIPLGETRLLEEHDLTNVLNQLPEDAFNDLFEVQQSEHYEPTQHEQDELARALEEVDEQVKSLEQMTGSTNFLENFLNVDDQILVDNSDICDEVLTTSSRLIHT